MLACSLSQFGGKCSSFPTSCAACMTCPWPLVTKESTSCVALRNSKASTIAAPPNTSTSPVTRRSRRISPNRVNKTRPINSFYCQWDLRLRGFSGHSVTTQLFYHQGRRSTGGSGAINYINAAFGRLPDESLRCPGAEAPAHMQHREQIKRPIEIALFSRRDGRIPQRLNELSGTRIGRGQAGHGVGGNQARTVRRVQWLARQRVEAAVGLHALRREEGLQAVAQFPLALVFRPPRQSTDQFIAVRHAS